MGLFRRRRPSPEELRAAQDAAIADFWSWWSAEGHARATVMFDDGGASGDLTGLAEEIGDRVQRIADLAFETGAGRGARHDLVVSAGGDPDLRDVADRWLAAAPAADDAFEYASWRQPSVDAAGLRIQYGPHDVALADATVAHLAEGTTLHVRVSHPRFASMPDEVQAQVTFLFLDAVLGERLVEERIGEISCTAEAVADGVPLTELTELVARLG